VEKAVETIGAVVIRGAGRCFSAGADISGPTWAPRRNFQASVIERLANLPQPVVAVVHGHCVTGGLELALAAESARFADRHATFRLAATWLLTQRLPRRIGPCRAREMMFTGRVFGGREAAEIGLASRCVPDADLESATAELVESITRGSWSATGNTTRRCCAPTGWRCRRDWPTRVFGRNGWRRTSPNARGSASCGDRGGARAMKAPELARKTGGLMWR
jgi:enoyl-CoA hydratase/carnithine racemase